MQVADFKDNKYLHKDELSNLVHPNPAANHPLLSGTSFAIISGTNPTFQPAIPGAGHAALGQELTDLGYKIEPTQGLIDPAWIVYNPDIFKILELGHKYGQETILSSAGGNHKLIYTSGPNEGRYHEGYPGFELFNHPPGGPHITLLSNHGPAGYIQMHFNLNVLKDQAPAIQEQLVDFGFNPNGQDPNEAVPDKQQSIEKSEYSLDEFREKLAAGIQEKIEKAQLILLDLRKRELRKNEELGATMSEYNFDGICPICEKPDTSTGCDCVALAKAEGKLGKALIKHAADGDPTPAEAHALHTYLMTHHGGKWHVKVADHAHSGVTHHLGEGSDPHEAMNLVMNHHKSTAKPVHSPEQIKQAALAPAEADLTLKSEKQEQTLVKFEENTDLANETDQEKHTKVDHKVAGKLPGMKAPQKSPKVGSGGEVEGEVKKDEMTAEASKEPLEKEHLGFEKLKNKLAHKPGITDPAAVAAAIGRKKYGPKAMAAKAAAGKKHHHHKAEEPLSKPPVSEAQRRAMAAAAHGHSTLDIPESVGKEFIDADKGGKLPEHKKKHKKSEESMAKGDFGVAEGGRGGGKVMASPPPAKDVAPKSAKDIRGTPAYKMKLPGRTGALAKPSAGPAAPEAKPGMDLGKCALCDKSEHLGKCE